MNQDGFFPADLMFLASTNPDGVCYVEVSTLCFKAIGFLILRNGKYFILEDLVHLSFSVFLVPMCLCAFDEYDLHVSCVFISFY